MKYIHGPVLRNEEEDYFYCRIWKNNMSQDPLFTVHGKTKKECEKNTNLLIRLWRVTKPETLK